MKDGLPSGVTLPAMRDRSWMCSSSISIRYKWPWGAAGTGTGGCGAVNVMCHSLFAISGTPHPSPAAGEPLTAVWQCSSLAQVQSPPSSAGLGLWKMQRSHGCGQKHQSCLGFSRCSPKYGQDEICCCYKMMQHLWAGPLSAHLTLTNSSH